MSDKTSIAAMLTKEQIEYLEDISRKMKQTGGAKLPRSAIIRNLVRLMGHLRPNVRKVKDEEELLSRLVESMENYR